MTSDINRTSLPELDDLPLWLTVPEVAKLLRVSRNYGYEMVERGEIPVVRFGQRTLRVPRVALERMMLDPFAGNDTSHRASPSNACEETSHGTR